MSASISETRARRIALLVASALFMTLLDGTVIATALPAMARALDTSAVNLNIGITAYLLTVAVCIPVSGWIAERFGARLVFGSAIVVFIAASVACGLARSVPFFVAARILQAMGGALMTPVGRLVVLNTTPKHRLMRAMAMMVWPALVAPILGPPIGGYVTTYLGWEWIFFLNVPLGIAAVIATYFLFPDDRPNEQHAFDLRGFALVGGACFTLMYGLDLIGQRQESATLIASLVGIGALLALLAVRHLQTTPNPLLDLRPLRIRTFAVNMAGGSITRIALGTAPFLLPLMFQIGFGLSAATSGLLVLWLFAGNLGMKTITTPLVRRFGFRRVLVCNAVLTAASLLICAGFGPSTPYVAIGVALFLGGAARSLQFTALSSIQFADVPPELMSSANTLGATVTQLSVGMSVALGALVLRASSLLHGHFGATPVVADFHLSFVIVAGFALLAIIDVWGLPADAALAVSRPRPKQVPT